MFPHGVFLGDQPKWGQQSIFQEPAVHHDGTRILPHVEHPVFSLASSGAHPTGPVLCQEHGKNHQRGPKK